MLDSGLDSCCINSFKRENEISQSQRTRLCSLAFSPTLMLLDEKSCMNTKIINVII